MTDERRLLSLWVDDLRINQTDVATIWDTYANIPEYEHLPWWGDEKGLEHESLTGHDWMFSSLEDVLDPPTSSYPRLITTPYTGTPCGCGWISHGHAVVRDEESLHLDNNQGEEGLRNVYDLRRNHAASKGRYHLIKSSDNCGIVRGILSAAEKAALGGDREIAALMEDIRVVVQVVQRNTWQKLWVNLALSLGQNTGAHILAQYRRNIQAVLSTILPGPLATGVTGPSPSLFVSACLILAIFVTAQYHYNRASVFQKPLLLTGVVMGFVASHFLSYPQDVAAVSATTAVIPTVTVVALLLNQVADAIRGCVMGKQERKHKLRRMLEGLHAKGSSHQHDKRQGV
ncbi:hypothetical protein EJ02DRAFT_512589 [Clathrospora elynae]|uniref:Uncharacterized protein n=1 Tax=Clathrospora elynae TaxID=706981 RepID=A0A6A5SVT1_9PLEO|nr:hypothetical protein EJ02DRAFT_512589 [Clathrospora elynae]